MSFVIVSTRDVLYGPTAISTEDAALHEQLAKRDNCLTISRRQRRHDKSARLDKEIRKYESKLAECRDDGKAEKIREKYEDLCQRKKERIALNGDAKINFDPSGKAIVFKVDDAPVRVLNQLSTLGYQSTHGAGGSLDGGGAIVWTLFKPDYVPEPIYPKLNLLSSTD